MMHFIFQLVVMAAAATASGDKSGDAVSYVYCLEVEPYLVDPRMLPCGHIFCSSCLSKDAKTNQIIQCANCGYHEVDAFLRMLSKKSYTEFMMISRMQKVDVHSNCLTKSESVNFPFLCIRSMYWAAAESIDASECLSID